MSIIELQREGMALARSPLTHWMWSTWMWQRSNLLFNWTLCPHARRLHGSSVYLWCNTATKLLLCVNLHIFDRANSARFKQLNYSTYIMMKFYVHLFKINQCHSGSTLKPAIASLHPLQKTFIACFNNSKLAANRVKTFGGGEGVLRPDKYYGERLFLVGTWTL